MLFRKRSFYSPDIKPVIESDFPEILPYVREVDNGAGERKLDAGLIQVLIFANGEAPAEPVLKRCHELIRFVIADLVNYGNRLLEIIKSEDEESKLRELNQSFDVSGLRELFNLIKKSKYRIDSARLGPPMFFNYSLVPETNDPAIIHTLQFLDACKYLHPAYWAQCDYCGRFYIRKRRRRTTRFCRDKCRYDFNNGRAERRSQKRVIAARERAGGNPKYF